MTLAVSSENQNVNGQVNRDNQQPDLFNFQRCELVDQDQDIDEYPVAGDILGSAKSLHTDIQIVAHWVNMGQTHRGQQRAEKA